MDLGHSDRPWLEVFVPHLNHSDSQLANCLNYTQSRYVNQSLDEAPKLTNNVLAKASILAAMAVAAIVGNTATITSITVGKKSTSSSLYILLFQLAISDLLVSIWCLSGEAAWTYTVEWKGGQYLCKIFKFSQVFSLYLSTYIMVLIGLDRLRAVRHPIRRVVSNHSSCVKPIIAVWIVSALLASPQLAIFSVMEGPFREPFYQCVTYEFYTERWQEQFYTIFSLLTMFVIPLVTLIASYVCILCTIARKESQFRAPPELLTREQLYQQQYQPPQPVHSNLTRRQNFLRRAKFKSLRISIVIVLAFFICWAPYYFMMITFIFLNPDDQLGADMQSAIFFFGMSNSLINPLIYGAFHLWKPKRKLGTNGSFTSGHTDSWGRRGSRRPGALRPLNNQQQPPVRPESMHPPPSHNGSNSSTCSSTPKEVSGSIQLIGLHHQSHKRCSLRSNGSRLLSSFQSADV